MTKTFARAAAVGAAALLLASCGERPDEGAGATPGATGGAAEEKFSACMVLDVGGVDDRSFNQSSWAGLQAAQKANPDIEISHVPSTDDAAYVPNLQAQVSKGCNTVIAVGGLMTDAVEEVATANPDQQFAQIDAAPAADNVYGMQFNTAEGGFLAGYLSAGMTKTGKVGTWGGLNIPPVTAYMDGFWEGVQHHNKEKGTDVQVLGWDETTQQGSFSEDFLDQAKGRSITETLISQGADIVLPVAGQSGLGAGAAAEAAKAEGKDVKLIWVDTDGCESAAQYCPFFLTSVTKNLSGAVEEYTTAAAGGEFPEGQYLGTLENEGTGIAPFHEFDSQVPAELKADLDKVKAGIIDGSITITSQSQPKE
ncbi:basic membrane protein A [Kineococcus xinjiangensis]|uniref:Basic membrane protein A n=1 Tax=Kineococcus xinjiangensis TaxID=512762 RepID=A0A2S6ITU7_9ACTN|nr:BMP family ABC transporter substrate-binding protein [Kineococcus xinjiangensis]PPK97674.1 basic membrane protein A [Kineococcus xinjiangensis]